MKKLMGKVVSNKMTKTVVVETERMVKHPLYQKFIRKTKKFKAHVEGMDLNVGDRVKLVKVRPMSKDKHYKVSEKI